MRRRDASGGAASRMTKQEVLDRVCLLQEEVHNHIRDGGAADCFCGKGGFNTPERPQPDECYRHDGLTLDFMEKAVRERMKFENSFRDKVAAFAESLRKSDDTFDKIGAMLLDIVAENGGLP